MRVGVVGGGGMWVQKKAPLGIICWVGCLLDEKTLHSLPFYPPAMGVT